MNNLQKWCAIIENHSGIAGRFTAALTQPTFSYSLLSVFLWRYKLQVFQNAGLHLLKVNIVKCLYVRGDSL